MSHTHTHTHVGPELGLVSAERRLYFICFDFTGASKTRSDWWSC